mgnify:CR=1 FL=1
MRVLHHYPLSPSSRLIRLYMNEKKIEFVTKLEIFWERNEKFLKLNPSGEVPVLIDLDNTVLCGSRIIVEYFEDLDKNIVLIPGKANEKACAQIKQAPARLTAQQCAWPKTQVEGCPQHKASSTHC